MKQSTATKDGPPGTCEQQQPIKKAERDIFDILDISHREDSYSSLLVEILCRYEEIRESVFFELTGENVLEWDPDPVRFRKDISDSDKNTKNIPDICLVSKKTAEEGVERHWLIMEAKVWAKEGADQCERYDEAANASDDCDKVTGCYLTLRGDAPGIETWQAWTHQKLYEMMNSEKLKKQLSGQI